MSLQLFVFDKILRFAMKRRFRRNPDVMTLRAIMAEMAARQPARVPAHIAMDEMVLGGVRTERLSRKDGGGRGAILYIHGGGWVGGVPANHRALTWRLADQIGATVYAIDYRLAPEHPFPAGLDDCVAAYKALLETHAPAQILIGGDSAGGNLTLATALKLKQLGLPQPAGLICLSPATELGAPLPSHASNGRSDAMFVPAMFDSVKGRYCPGADGSDPLISPLRGDVAGLPPVLLQCSAIEMLRDDSTRMAEKLRAAGVDATLQVWPGVFHVWQVAADQLPEARKAIGGIAAFAKARLNG